MKIINLYGGPGTGKSTTASDLFALMKWKKYNVELVSEYAKIITWEGRHEILKDQLYLLAKQNRMLERLRNQVEYVVTDSPLILCSVYSQHYFPDTFVPFAKQVFESYDNINIMLERQKDYSPIGRNQTEAEAKILDIKVEDMLNDNKYEYHRVLANEDAKTKILEIITCHSYSEQ